MKEINVHIGEVKIGKNNDVLKALLGSCVGIGFLWERKHLCGLAHCLLPSAPTHSFNVGGRFVDQAIPSLLALMKIKTEDFPEIKAILVGGGNMTNQKNTTTSQAVGISNIREATTELQKLGIPIVFEKTGGNLGYKIKINCSDYTYEVKHIPKMMKET